MSDPRKNTRDVYPPTGPEITAKSWLTEAPMRMLMNNLHPGRRGEPARAGGLWRDRAGGADLGGFRPDRRDAEDARGRRDAAGAVGQAGGGVQDTCGRAAGADRQLEPGAALGDLGAFQRARSQGADDVRPDDRGVLDLHRQPGDRAGHLRDLRRGRAQALWRLAQGQVDPDRRARRHGRGAAAGGGLRRGMLPRGGVQPRLDRVPAADPIPRREGRDAGRGAGDDRALDRRRRGEVGRAPRQRGGRLSRSWCGAGCGRTSSPTRPARTTRSTATCRRAGRWPSGARGARATPKRWRRRRARR